MFLSHDFRRRAVGLIVAYAVLIAGIVLGGAFDSSHVKSAPQAAAEPQRVCTDAVC